jgi:anti-anti-sigma regulatory factor
MATPHPRDIETSTPAGWGPGLSVRTDQSGPTVIITGLVDRDLAGRADPLLQVTTFSRPGTFTIDVSGVESVSGALLGLLLRASRRLAWRGRELIIVCRDPDKLRRLETAGLDELAQLVGRCPAERERRGSNPRPPA